MDAATTTGAVAAVTTAIGVLWKQNLANQRRTENKLDDCERWKAEASEQIRLHSVRIAALETTMKSMTDD